jgi:DNA-binding NarL/FixJ family response regulator
MRVLIVDDDPLFRLGVAAALAGDEQLEFILSEAGDGQAALALIAAEETSFSSLLSRRLGGIPLTRPTGRSEVIGTFRKRCRCLRGIWGLMCLIVTLNVFLLTRVFLQRSAAVHLGEGNGVDLDIHAGRESGLNSGSHWRRR